MTGTVWTDGHDLRLERSGYAQRWVCACGFAVDRRDSGGHLIAGTTLIALKHPHYGARWDGLTVLEPAPERGS